MLQNKSQVPVQPEIDNRTFYRKVFALVLPLTIQNLINTGVTAADVIMLGGVNETVLSAASLASQIQFIMTLFLFGLTSGATVLTSQYWGKRDTETIEKIIGLGLRFAIFIAVLFGVLAFFFPQYLMRIYTTEADVIAEGVKYLRIVAFSYIFTAVSTAYLHMIRSIERVIISTIINAVSLLTNIFINWIFIYGNLGMPRLEAQGAAIGTLCSRVLEFALMFLYAFYVNKDVRIRIKYIFRGEKWLFLDFMKYSGPVIINELLWGAGSSANTAIMGHMGKAAAAANSIAQVERQLATVVSFGIAAAAAIMVGKAIGEEKIELAKLYAKKLIKVTLFAGIGGACAILATGPLILNFMSLSQAAKGYFVFMMFVMCYFTIAQAFNSLMIVGVFRGGGDTKMGLILDVCSMWCCSILLGFIAAFVFKFNVYIVYVVLMSDELIKLPVSAIRYRSYKWINQVTRA